MLQILRKFNWHLLMVNIIFYFPYRKIGGVSQLFLSLSAELSKDYKVHLVDFRDGAMAKLIPNGVNFIDFDEVISYPENSVLVLQSLPIWNIKDLDKFPRDTKLFFWNLHPLNLYPYIFSIYSKNKLKAILARILNPMSLFRRIKLSNLLTYLTNNNALVFMDQENCRRTQSFFPNVSLSYKLLPITTGRIQSRAKVNDSEVIKCCWIGRIVDFKLYILIHTIERLNAASTKIHPIEIAIIGEGDEMFDLKVACEKFCSIDIKFLGEMSPSDLDKYLANNVDVLFAMGTSALEGASRKIPTLLLDYTYNKIEDLYKFDYIFNTKGYSLGTEFDSLIHSEKSSSLEATLLSIKYRKKEIGLSCYQYWKNNFSPKIVSELFVREVNKSTATIGHVIDLELTTPDIFSSLFKGGMRKKTNTLSGFNEL